MGEVNTEAAQICQELAEVQLDVPPERALIEPVEPVCLLTARDVAERLQVDAKTVRRWRAEGKLPPPVKLGGVVRWLAEDLAVWLKEQRR